MGLLDYITPSGRRRRRRVKAELDALEVALTILVLAKNLESEDEEDKTVYDHMLEEGDE